MVKIYLDGLMPRVEKLWEKLGKQPKKLEVKLLDTSEMDAELAKAKAEKEKAAKQEAAQQPAKQDEKEEEKELTPEEIAQKEDQIKELQGQIDTALDRGDKQMAGELLKEIPSIIKKFPDAKKKEWNTKLEELKKKIGG